MTLMATFEKLIPHLLYHTGIREQLALKRGKESYQEYTKEWEPFSLLLWM